MDWVPGTLDQKKIYAIRSFGLNEIIHFSDEQYDSLGRARVVGETGRRDAIYGRSFTALQGMEILHVWSTGIF